MKTLPLITLLLFCSGSLLPARAELSDAEHLELISKEDPVDQAIAKGLSWLVKQQDSASGSFGNTDIPNTCTALSCIALMAAGHQPGRTLYGEQLRLGILYLLRSARKTDWYFGRENNGRMYAHGIATLALTEAYGMMQEDQENLQIKEVLEKCIAIILNCQYKENNRNFGGWRYDPNGADADLSVSVWQALVLRSAQNSQIVVPDTSIQDACTYIRATYNEQHQAFTYQGGEGVNTPAMNSAGIVAMYVLGLRHDAEDLKKIESSARNLLTVDPLNGEHMYYQDYYLATAANMMGGKYRNSMLPKMEAALLSLQEPSGEFRKHRGYKEGVYATAFATIILCVRYQYLPIYQE